MAIDPNWVRENPEEAARQIELLIKERDQYRAAEEAQIALRVKAVESEQALAKRLAEGSKQTELDPKMLNHFTCERVNNAGGTPGFTLFMTKMGASHTYQLYQNEAAALHCNLSRALGINSATNLARRDEIKKAEGAVDFVSWLEKECERNGEVGEIFGMTLSGITAESRAAPNLRAARTIFAEAKKMAEWKLGQVVVVKS